MLQPPTRLPIATSTMQKRRSEFFASNLSPLEVSPPDWGRLTSIQDELHDVKRVYRQGQEEDLRAALGRMINRVEEMSSLLTEAYKSQTELETSLKLAKSNLQLSLANNEMLEDALKRDTPGRGKDIGWRRGGDRSKTPSDIRHTAARSSSESQASLSPTSQSLAVTPLSSAPNTPAMPSEGPPVSPYLIPTPSPQLMTSSPPVVQDSRFFRFRFGSSTPSRPQSPPALQRRPDLDRDALHLTSASLPSLVVPPVAGPSEREEELALELDKEKKKHTKISEEKKALEAELESLSQALFEEANRMVAEERIKRAETEEELRQARNEKEALKGALRVIESENGQLRERTTSPIADDQRTLRLEDSGNRSSLHSSDFRSPSPPDNSTPSPPGSGRSDSSSSTPETSASELIHHEDDPSSPPFMPLDDLKSWSARARSPSSIIALKTPPLSPSAGSLEIDELEVSPWGR